MRALYERDCLDEMPESQWLALLCLGKGDVQGGDERTFESCWRKNDPHQENLESKNHETQLEYEQPPTRTYPWLQSA